MDASFGLIMLVGKYLFLGLVYVFLYWAFRGLFAQMRTEAPVAAPAGPIATATVAPPATAPTITAPPAAVATVAPIAAARPVAPVVSPALATLIVQNPGASDLKAGQVINLTAAVTIGRADDNGLVVRDKFCSQHHAMIFLQQGTRLLRDRNSTNGTLHNGQPVTGDVILSDGDRINIGTASLIYRTAS